jgi:hypothetical protein
MLPSDPYLEQRQAPTRTLTRAQSIGARSQSCTSGTLQRVLLLPEKVWRSWLGGSLALSKTPLQL